VSLVSQKRGGRKHAPRNNFEESLALVMFFYKKDITIQRSYKFLLPLTLHDRKGKTNILFGIEPWRFLIEAKTKAERFRWGLSVV